MTSIPIPASRMSLAELQEDADGQPRLYLTVTMGADEVALTRSQCAEILEQLQPYLSPEHSAAARSLASPETGEFGECLGFTDDGDLAEWIPDDAAPDGAWLLIQLRNRDAIGEVWSECRDKVWWNRHQNWLCALETGAEVLSEG